jgi:hypothetical protein
VAADQNTVTGSCAGWIEERKPKMDLLDTRSLASGLFHGKRKRSAVTETSGELGQRQNLPQPKNETSDSNRRETLKQQKVTQILVKKMKGKANSKSSMQNDFSIKIHQDYN